MSLVFRDGFDHYVQPQATYFNPMPGWDSFFSGGGNFFRGVGSSFGRCGSNGLIIIAGNNTGDAYGFVKNIPVYTKYFMGIAVNVSGISANIAHMPLFGLSDGQLPQVAVALNANGTLELRTGYTSQALGGADPSVLLGSTTYQLPFTDFHFIELEVVANSATGSAILRVDNNTVLSLTNVNTVQSTGVNQISGVALGKPMLGASWASSNILYDDLYVLDDKGANAWVKTFLGDTRIRTLFPTANGSRTAWAANGAASQWQCVNEVTITGGDGDTTYISSAAAGDIQYFTFPGIPSGATVLEVCCLIDNRKDDGLARTMSGQVRSPAGGATEATGPAFNLPTSYGYNQVGFETDPATGAQWTAAGVNAAEFGVKDIS